MKVEEGAPDRKKKKIYLDAKSKPAADRCPALGSQQPSPGKWDRRGLRTQRGTDLAKTPCSLSSGSSQAPRPGSLLEPALRRSPHLSPEQG